MFFGPLRQTSEAGRVGIFLGVLVLHLAVSVRADRYVNVHNSSPASPYDTWAKAATQIQLALNVASAGETVWVSNGVYTTGRTLYPPGPSIDGWYARAVVPPGVTLRSVNGPEATSIKGDAPVNSTRCAYLRTNAIISGFTLTNGYAAPSAASDWARSGGGAFCEEDGTISNCIIRNCVVTNYGGGVLGGALYDTTIENCSALSGGGTYSSVVYRSSIRGNTARGTTSAYGGGGIHFGAAYDSTIASNYSESLGGGTYFCSVYGCLVAANRAMGDGGGVSYGSAEFSIIRNNVTTNGGSDGGISINSSYFARNCLIVGNIASGRGGGGGGGGARFQNCTVVSNRCIGTSFGYGGGLYFNSQGSNCIVYHNVLGTQTNAAEPSGLVYSCKPSPYESWLNNITNEPQFVDFENGDYRLSSTSPCINTGSNYVNLLVTTDLAGNPRRIGYSIDMGAYEYAGNGVGGIAPQAGGIDITLDAVPGQPYRFQSSGDLSGPSWDDVGNVVTAQTTTLTVTDTNAPSPQRFYRTQMAEP